MKITKWFYIAFGSVFILYSLMLSWGAEIAFFDDISFIERIKSYFMFYVVDDILYKLAFSMAFAVILNFFVIYLRKNKSS